MKLFIKVFIGFLFVVIFLVAGVIVYISNTNLNQYRDFLESIISENSHFEVLLKGDIYLDFSSKISLNVSDIEVLSDGYRIQIDKGLFDFEIEPFVFDETMYLNVLSSGVEISYDDKRYVLDSLSFDFVKNEDNLLFENLSIDMNDSDLKGSVNIFQNRHLDIELFSKNLNLNFLQSDDTNSSFFNDMPIDIDFINDLSLKLTYKGDMIQIENHDFRDVDIFITLKDNLLNIEKLSAGDLISSMVVDGSSYPIHGDINVSSRDILFEEIFKDSNNSVKSGVLHSDIFLQTYGNSTNDFLSNLSGDVIFLATNMQMKNSFISFVGGDFLFSLLSKLNPFVREKEFMDFSCGVMNFQVQEGILRAQKGIAFESKDVNIIGSGDIDLKTKKIDLNINTNPIGGVGVSLGDIANIVSIGGDISNPKIKVDALKTASSALKVAGAIATGGLSLLGEGAIKKVVDDAHPCKSALQGKMSDVRW